MVTNPLVQVLDVLEHSENCMDSDRVFSRFLERKGILLWVASDEKQDQLFLGLCEAERLSIVVVEAMVLKMLNDCVAVKLLDLRISERDSIFCSFEQKLVFQK